MKSIAKKMLTVVMSLMLVCTMGATALSADVLTAGNLVKDVNCFDITKNLEVPKGANLPNETFTFIVAPRNVAEGSFYNDTKLNYYKGIDATGETTKTLSTAAMTLKNTEADGTKVYEGAVTVDITQATFTAPGVYAYTVTERTGSTAGMTYDHTTYNVDVYVQYDETAQTYKAAAVICKKSDDTAKSPILFTNELTTQSLSVVKDVTGNQGDRSRAFNFTATFKVAAGVFEEGSTLTGTIKRANGNETIVFTAGEGKTFTLADNDELVIEGLPQGVEYTITEEDYSDEGYTTTINDVEENTITDTMAADSVSIKVVNDKQGTTPTGIATTVLPFALLLVVALAGGVVMARRRRAED